MLCLPTKLWHAMTGAAAAHRINGSGQSFRAAPKHAARDCLVGRQDRGAPKALCFALRRHAPRKTLLTSKPGDLLDPRTTSLGGGPWCILEARTPSTRAHAHKSLGKGMGLYTVRRPRRGPFGVDDRPQELARHGQGLQGVLVAHARRPLALGLGAREGA